MIEDINKKIFSLVLDFSISDIHEISLRILKGSCRKTAFFHS